MNQILGFLNLLVSIYMMIIFVRIILTWFSWLGGSKIQEILAMITDPYLNWFRRFTFLKAGFVDLSPIAALAVLSLVSRILAMLAIQGRISIGIILALVLQAFWGMVSFIIGFLIIVLAVRLVGYFAKQSSYTPFWRIIDSISQPVIYRINSFFFKDRILQISTAIIISAASLAVAYVVLKILVSVLSGILVRLPF